MAAWVRWPRAAVAATVGVAALAITVGAGWPLGAASTLFADAGDPGSVMRGKQVYMGQCASCHGRNLQGQPLWQLADRYAHQRAPALGPTGSAWQHSDAALFQLVRAGHPPDTGSGTQRFGAALAEADALAVVAFIKARWPVGLRVMQAMQNPSQAGMPVGAAADDWRLPIGCAPHS
jgi:mono/diheme cytochrome c family protein